MLKALSKPFKFIKEKAEDLFCRYIVYWHGFGTPGQDYFYRWQRCHGLITWNKIHKGGCDCSGGSRIYPANPKLSEWVRLIIMPWSVR